MKSLNYVFCALFTICLVSCGGTEQNNYNYKEPTTEKKDPTPTPNPTPTPTTKCGDGKCDASTGETFETCPSDCDKPATIPPAQKKYYEIETCYMLNTKVSNTMYGQASGSAGSTGAAVNHNDLPVSESGGVFCFTSSDTIPATGVKLFVEPTSGKSDNSAVVWLGASGYAKLMSLKVNGYNQPLCVYYNWTAQVGGGFPAYPDKEGKPRFTQCPTDPAQVPTL